MKAMLQRFGDGRRQFSAHLTLAVLFGVFLVSPLVVAQILSETKRTLIFHQTLDRSVERRAEVWRIFTALLEAEAAGRGYVLTGVPNFFESYESAAGPIPAKLQSLETRVAGTALQELTRELNGLIRAKLDEIALTITVFKQNSLAGVAQVIAEKGDGIPHIRAKVEEMEALENLEIARVSAEIRVQAANSEMIALLLFGGIMLLVLVTAAAGLAHLAQRRATEDELRRARELAEFARRAAERANEGKTEFLATMSHEIRTPLHSVIGTTELLLDGDGLRPRQREYVERIQTAGTALLNVVNDVLDLSKIEAGKIQLVREPFSPHTLVAHAVSIVRSAVQKKNLTLRVELDDGLPGTLEGDAPRLGQVLLNLLNNAVKFTGEGTIVLRVEHRGATHAGEQLRFSVSDTGRGIPEHQRQLLFKRFEQIDQSAGRGSGLGLAIAKRLIELMGGRIGFESEVGRGSTFWYAVTLPRAEAAPKTVERDDLRERPSGGQLLLVDDIEQNRDLAQTMLESAGYSVDVASDGAAAVAAVQAKRYDLVLMDVQMSGMDGIAATRIIRNLSAPSKDVPIIAMTANVLSHDVSAFKAAGMSAHLGKPFTRKELLRTVRNCLRATHAKPRRSSKAASAQRPVAPGVAAKRRAPSRPASTDPTKNVNALQALMGPDWTRRGLTDLKEQLRRTFASEDAEGIDREWLGRQAHMLVSRASMLGFPELSDCCRDLERDCRNKVSIAQSYAKAREAAASTEAAAYLLLEPQEG